MIRKIARLAHDPVTIAPFRRQAVADIGKDCALSFVTAVIPQAIAPGSTPWQAGDHSLEQFCGLTV